MRGEEDTTPGDLLVDLQAAARNCSSLEDSYRIGRNLDQVEEAHPGAVLLERLPVEADKFRLAIRFRCNRSGRSRDTVLAVGADWDTRVRIRDTLGVRDTRIRGNLMVQRVVVVGADGAEDAVDLAVSDHQDTLRLEVPKAVFARAEGHPEGLPKVVARLEVVAAAALAAMPLPVKREGAPVTK